jgi:hypothetical protein
MVSEGAIYDRYVRGIARVDGSVGEVRTLVRKRIGVARARVGRDAESEQSIRVHF